MRGTTKPWPLAVCIRIAALTTVLVVYAAAAEEQRREIAFQPGEHWWAGVIAEAHRMPFTAESKFEFDFFGDTAGNQGQPLLISDQGRYIWCDEPFRFEFDRGKISDPKSPMG